MKDDNSIIHIDWDGPIGINELGKISDPKTDYGVYQIYGNHSIYGKDVLLYIGKASKQIFSERISQEGWLNTNNYEKVQIYVGRLAGNSTPSEEIWEKQIELAEKLLIYSHKPAFNAMSIHTIPDRELYSIHLLNWGIYNCLLPEVSGARWTSKYDAMPSYEVYGDHA